MKVSQLRANVSKRHRSICTRWFGCYQTRRMTSEPDSDLGRAYTRYNHAARASRQQKEIMGWVSVEVLDGIATLAAGDSTSKIAQKHAQLLELLDNSDLARSEPLRDEFETAYREAERLVFPAAAAFQEHMQDLSDWTHNHSLAAIDLGRIRGLDLKAHEDSAFNTYVEQLCGLLPDISRAPSVRRYSQFFEVYSEALVLDFLQLKLPTRKIPEGEEKTPDFECELPGQRPFYIEVKTFDIVGGDLRHDEAMVDAIDAEVSLDEQIEQGESLATAEGELAPYQRYKEHETYDPRSLERVISTLREKYWQAFKAGQFALGPTFALAATDRLVVPGGRCALAPYYYDPDNGGSCVSGVLWHTAFGATGAPVLLPPDFEGSANLEGYLTQPGLFEDGARPFQARGLITLSRSRDQEKAYGLYPSKQEMKGWTVDDTRQALAAVCENYNDDQNSHAFELSHC